MVVGLIVSGSLFFSDDLERAKLINNNDGQQCSDIIIDEVIIEWPSMSYSDH